MGVTTRLIQLEICVRYYRFATRFLRGVQESELVLRFITEDPLQPGTKRQARSFGGSPLIGLKISVAEGILT